MKSTKIKTVRSILLMATIVAIAIVVTVALKISRHNTSSAYAESTYIAQDITKATFMGQGEFQIGVEQDDDAPLKILDARVSVISGDQYHDLTSQPQRMGEVMSVPRVVLQNVSDKTVTGIGLIIIDKAAHIKRGFYMREKSIKPGQHFTIVPENLVRVGGNPAQNPKFWLDAVDKTKLVVRVGAFFEDGSMWTNRDQRY